MSDKPEIENKTVQDDNTPKYLLNNCNEIPAQDDQMHTICNQNTTQYKTLELKVENKDTCIVINEKTIPPKVHLKPVLDQYEPLILRKEQNTTNETVKINIEEDNRIAVNTKENDLQNKNIAENAENASIKNKLEPITVTEERIGEWVFMYQQPQPYYPPPQYPPYQYPPYQYPPPQYPPPQYGQSLTQPPDNHPTTSTTNSTTGNDNETTTTTRCNWGNAYLTFSVVCSLILACIVGRYLADQGII